MVTVVTEELIGALLHSIFYGMYLIASVVSAYCIYYIRAKKIAPNKVVVAASAALFVLVTLFYVANMFFLVDMFSTHSKNPEDRADAFKRYSPVRSMIGLVSVCVMVLMDALLAYRLYIIYLKDVRIVIIPGLSALCLVCVSVAQAVISAQDHQGVPKVPSSSSGRLPTVATVLSLVSCAYSTLLIAFRIIKHGRAFRQFGMRTNILCPALSIIIESGLVYTSLLSIMLALYLARSSATHLFFQLVPPLIGLNNSVVLIRIGLGITDITQSNIVPPTISVTLPSQIALATESMRGSTTVAPTPTYKMHEPIECDEPGLSGESPDECKIASHDRLLS
jgi:hypothetical protein